MNRTRTMQAHRVMDLLKADRAGHHARLSNVLPVGTPVSWTTIRGDQTFRHYGEVEHAPSACDLSFSVRNYETLKSTRIYATSTYGFQVEDDD